VTEDKKSHFEGKSAMQHIAEKKTEGIVASSEIHGAETPGSIFAGCDAAREAAVIALLLGTELLLFNIPLHQAAVIIFLLGIGFAFWKFGRAAHLAWSRLERLHRVANEEKNEIEINREEEREELRALYEAKGLQGKLLDEVVEVFMADGDRLLRVMLQEEMGFRLEENEHPLIQGLGAGIGALFGIVIPVLGLYLCHGIGLVTGSIVVLMTTSFVAASFQKNRTIPAMIWILGIALFSYVAVLSLTRFCLGKGGA